jgi:hypothetical protein
LLEPSVRVLAEDWPRGLPTDVIAVPIQRIDGHVAAAS